MVTISNSTLRARGLEGEHHKMWRHDIETPVVVSLYEQGISIAYLSRIFKCDRNLIKNRLKEWDIEIKPQSFYLKENNRTKGERNARWSGGTDQYWKSVLIDERGEACEICKFDIHVQVHHIDENRKNNNKNNLLLLCPNCHFSHHHSRTHRLKKKGNKWSLSQI